MQGRGGRHSLPLFRLTMTTQLPGMDLVCGDVFLMRYPFDLAFYRMATAESDIKSARILLEAGEYRGANNRAYYGIFHGISAVHAVDGNSYKRHKDALANFNKEYVKTEIFPRELGRRIAEAEEIRHASDYDDFYFATKEEAEEMIATAERLLERVRAYISNKN